MFKQRKSAGSGSRRSWAKTSSAVLAAVAGMVGGLMFWRKRRPS